MLRLNGHKYGAKKTEVDGIVFDSKREAAHYSQLRLGERAGVIKELELQPAFPLYVSQGGHKYALIGKYIADFRYREGPEGLLRIDDVKGFDTPLSRWKRKHAEAQYGIQIRIIK